MSGEERQPARDTVDFFDGVAETYAERYDAGTPGSLAFRLRKQRVLEMFDRPGGTVLDLGCGTGVIVDELLALECRLVGLDPAPGMIARARVLHESKPGARFAVGFAEQIDQPDEFFDAVICMGVFERVANADGALAEMHRVLKPGGTLLISLPNCRSPYFLWRDYVYYPVVSLLRSAYYGLRGRRPPVRIPGHGLFSPESFARDLTRHGSRVTAVEYTVFNPVLPPLESLLPGLAASLMERLESLRSTRLRSLGAAFIVKATKESSSEAASRQ